MEFLRNIQSKSSSVKAQYAFAIASIVTAIVGMFWITTLSFSSSDVQPIQVEKEGGSLADFLGDTQEQFGNVIDATKEGAEFFNQVSEVLEGGESLETDVDVTNVEIQGALGSLNERHTSLEPEPESPFAPKTPSSTPTTTSSETKENEWETWEKRVLIETTKTQPKKVLISTSTSPKIE